MADAFLVTAYLTNRPTPGEEHMADKATHAYLHLS
jgi:hypothetical protein